MPLGSIAVSSRLKKCQFSGVGGTRRLGLPIIPRQGKIRALSLLYLLELVSMAASAAIFLH
jgi:hypothetical protein